MSLLDLASLVLSPTATKEGKVYSAIPDTGDGDMTFTRGSAATRVNSAGLIEKERANLLVQSNTFDTTWVNNLGGAITGGQSGYDGSNDAWEINKNTTSFRRLEQTVSLTGIWTFSVYAKAGTREEMALRDGTSGDRAEFDLDSGTIVNNGGGTIIERNMTDVGGGWYRCSITCNSTNTLVQIYIDWNETIGGNIYIQDAQVEEGLVATDVIETTTSAVYEGITDDVPRVDYSGGGCPALKLEPQRSNLITQSEYFNDSSWTSSGTSILVTSNAETSPDGTINASKLIEGSATSFHRLQANLTATAATYSYSVYLKAGEREYAYIFMYDNTTRAGAYFNLAEGSINSITSGTADIEDVGNGWYRCIVTGTFALTSVRTYISISADGVTDIYNGDGTSGIYAYGAMLEAGSYSTSYIPTYSVSSTRVADSCLDAGDSSTFNDSEGVIFLEAQGLVNGGENRYITLSDNTSSNRLHIVYSGSANRLQIFGTSALSGNFTAINYNSFDQTDLNKVAVKYSATELTLFVNGVKIESNSSNVSFANNTLDSFDFALWNEITAPFQAKLYQTLYFPTALTDDECIALTK